MLTAGVLFSAPSVRAELYKYTDDTGGVHYVGSPSQIPPKYQRQSQSQTVKTTQTGQVADTSGPAREISARSVFSRREFWTRRKAALEQRVNNLSGDCAYWEAAGSRDSLAALKDIACAELKRARADLDNLPQEIRKAGGNPAWLH